MAQTSNGLAVDLAATLAPLSELAAVSATQLARRGTEMLRTVVETDAALRVQVQGQDALVVMPRRQYERLRELLAQVVAQAEPDPMLAALEARFDELAAQMARPETARATHDALFGDAAALASTYAPGATERDASSR